MTFQTEKTIYFVFTLKHTTFQKEKWRYCLSSTCLHHCMLVVLQWQAFHLFSSVPPPAYPALSVSPSHTLNPYVSLGIAVHCYNPLIT